MERDSWHYLASSINDQGICSFSWSDWQQLNLNLWMKFSLHSMSCYKQHYCQMWKTKSKKEQMLITGNKWLNIQTPLKKRHWNLTCRLSSHKSEEIIMNLAKARVEAVRNSASAYFPGLVQTAQISGLGTIQNISYIEPRIEISRFSFHLSTSFQLECSQSREENFHIFFNQQCLPCQEEVSWATGN